MSTELINRDIKMCRICLQDEENDDLLINPCRCSGTSKYVHKECLDTWRHTNIESESFLKCMECHTYYQFERSIPEVKLFFFNSKLVQIFTYFPSLMIAIMFGIIESFITNFSVIDFLNFGNKTTKDYNCYKVRSYSIYQNHTYKKCEPLTLKGFIRNQWFLTTSFYLSFWFLIQSLTFVIYHRYVMYRYIIRLKEYWKLYQMDYIVRLLFYNRFLIGYYLYVYNTDDIDSAQSFIIGMVLSNMIEGTINVGFISRHKKRINYLNDSREGVEILPYIDEDDIELNDINVNYRDDETEEEIEQEVEEEEKAYG